jgi:AbrB family looped-hinge helix DNA binding protein
MSSHTVRVDPKGRLMIPRPLREGLGIEPGDAFFVEADEEHTILRFAKAENPFDVLARHAERERQAGRTRNIRAFALDNDLTLIGE